jgi:hypothetical protein
MGRSLPKIVVLIAIGILLAAIFVVQRRGSAPEPGVVYVNPSIGTAAPPAPAP